MTKEEKRNFRISVLEEKIMMLESELYRLRNLKLRSEEAGIALKMEMDKFHLQGQLQGCIEWLNQLKNN